MDVVKTQPQTVQPAAAATREPRITRALAIENGEERQQLLRALTGSIENAVTAPQRMEVRMQVEENLDRVITRVVDSDTGEVIREVPPDELVELAKRMKALGAMLDRRA